MGDTAPAKKGHSRPLLAHVYCREMARLIKVPLGRKVGLCSGHIVLDGDLVPSTAPNFQSMSVVAKQSPISATAEHL